MGSSGPARRRDHRSRQSRGCWRTRTKQVGRQDQDADQTIFINRATLAALREWRKVQDVERAFFRSDYHPGDYVFTYQDGRPPHPDTIRQRFDRLAAAAGLARNTFDDLRHCYATAALKAGVSPKVVSDRIGHANVGFFLETYAHVLKKDDREADEQAASFLLRPDLYPSQIDELARSRTRSQRA